jgi:hypothetical protein
VYVYVYVCVCVLGLSVSYNARTQALNTQHTNIHPTTPQEYKRAIANGMKKSPSNDLRAFAFSRAQPAWKAWQSNIDGSGHDFVDALNRPGDGKPPHNPSSSAAAAATASALRPRAPHSRRDTAKQLSATARGRRKLVGLEGDVMQPSPSDFDDLQHTARYVCLAYTHTFTFTSSCTFLFPSFILFVFLIY